VIWIGKRKQQIAASWEPGSLEEAVDRARMDWQNAQHLLDVSEPTRELEDAIYYLQLTEKRYMYLLQQAKREHLGMQF
jgi:hypothetical protein